ncbi:hypothetical protein FOG51_01406 [Hanseniaspora uvarum]|nr:hypothetical protein FOG51_01406 [Hanseniaspora uvarum]KAF0278623.1 hypothetical protein FOG50_00516 [Hanseniaspora uvarum]
MVYQEKNDKHLRRVCFVDEADYNLFRNHLIEPLTNNIDDLQTFLESVVAENKKSSSDTKSFDISFYKKMDKQIQKHIIYKKIYDSYLPFTHPHEFLILILKQLFKIIHFDQNKNICDSVEESSLINESLMILIRFVNGLLDYFQKFKFAQSLVKLGEAINLPQWIVELRHSGTHERKLPNMLLIKKGLYFSLHYILDNFWSNKSTFTNNTLISTLDESEQDLKNSKSEDKELVLLNNKRRADESIDELHQTIALNAWEHFFDAIKKDKNFPKTIEIVFQELNSKNSSGFKADFIPGVSKVAYQKLNSFLEQVRLQWKQMYDFEKYLIIKTHYNLFVKNTSVRTFTHFCCLTLYKFDFYFLQVSAGHPNFNSNIKLLNLKKLMDNFESSMLDLDISILKKVVEAIPDQSLYKDIRLTLEDAVSEKQKQNQNVQVSNDNMASGSKCQFDKESIEEKVPLKVHDFKNLKFETLPDWKPKPFGVL